MVIGAVLELFEDDISKPKSKFSIVVGINSSSIATVFINTLSYYDDLAPSLQALNCPISPSECAFLDHDSYVDCSELKVRDKTKINNILQKDKYRQKWILTGSKINQILSMVKNAKSISPSIKTEFGLKKD